MHKFTCGPFLYCHVTDSALQVLDYSSSLSAAAFFFFFSFLSCAGAVQAFNSSALP